jgi:hypothetical protein
MSAKREETREKRLGELIDRAAKRVRIGVLARPDAKKKTKR